ncbi:MAG: GNAT family N-acetyltransferase [Nocardioidaceae bacterium]
MLLSAGRLVGAVRGRLHDATWDVGRLMVAPDLQGRGLGRLLLERIEAAAPPEATGFELLTGAGSARNQRIYKKAGYRSRGQVRPGVVRMTKRRG